jgi:hypothetical protein
LAVDRKPIPGELKIFSHQQTCIGFEEFRTAQLGNGVDTEVVQKMQETLDSFES